MNSLKELREWFLEDPEHRAKAFEVADYYLVKYDDNPEMTKVPASCIYAKPVVESFAGDSLLWAKWIRKVANTYLERGCEHGKVLREVAKDAQSRGSNQRARMLKNEALRQALARGIVKDTKLEKGRYKRRVGEWIKREYKLFLGSHRRATKENRISLDERDELVTKWWDDLLQQFLSGDIPEA